MGYHTWLTGCFNVEPRRLPFLLEFNLPLKKNQSRIERLNSDIFGFIICLSYYNDNPLVLHQLSLISKTFYYLCSAVKQEKIFTKVSAQVTRMLHGLQKTRRMCRCRFINSIDYGIDGQYFVDQDEFKNYETCDKYSSFYYGKPLQYNYSPRTQPSLYLKWEFDQENQTIKFDPLSEKFYKYHEWLIYLVNHFLHPNGYIIFGQINWQGENNDDFGTILFENDGLNNMLVSTHEENDRCSPEKVIKLQTLSQLKRKNIMWKDEFEKVDIGKDFGPKVKNLVSLYFDKINDKLFIESNKELHHKQDLLKTLQVSNSDDSEIFDTAKFVIRLHSCCP